MRRGTIYVLVLGASLVLLAIGLSAISLSRASAYNTSQSNDWLDSQLMAFSAAEHALTKINADDNWRVTYNGVTVRKSISGKSFTWRVVDEQDGDLGDNAADPAVLLVTSSAGKGSYAMKLDLEVTSGGGAAGTVLWGVDAEDGTLFATASYSRVWATTTRYGQLKWSDNGTIRNVGAGIRGMTITPAGDAYMILNANLGGRAKPVLLKYNVNSATATGNNIVTIVGAVPWNKDITGLAYDPDTGKLYALGLNGNSNQADRLLILNKDSGALTQNVGAMSGAGQNATDGSDICLDDQGNLYVADGADRHLYQLDKATGAITAMVDNQMTASGTMDGLAWDSHGQKLIGASSVLGLLYWVTLRNGENIVLGSYWLAGLNNIEAISFVPSGSGGGGSLVVRPALTGSSIKRTVQ